MEPSHHVEEMHLPFIPSPSRVTDTTAANLDEFRPLVASAIAAFGLDYRYCVDIAEASNTLTRKRAELDRVRALRMPAGRSMPSRADGDDAS
jgi:hypothetical protein